MPCELRVHSNLARVTREMTVQIYRLVAHVVSYSELILMSLTGPRTPDGSGPGFPYPEA